MAEMNISTPMSAPRKMKLLFTVVNREKTEFYTDLLQNFEVNMQMVLAANGTADTDTLRYLGLPSSEKSAASGNSPTPKLSRTIKNTLFSLI
jgi:hypothetical protein